LNLRCTDELTDYLEIVHRLENWNIQQRRLQAL